MGSPDDPEPVDPVPLVVGPAPLPGSVPVPVSSETPNKPAVDADEEDDDEVVDVEDGLEGELMEELDVEVGTISGEVAGVVDDRPEVETKGVEKGVEV